MPKMFDLNERCSAFGDLPLDRTDASIPSTTSDSVFISSSARLLSSTQEHTETEKERQTQSQKGCSEATAA